MKIQLQPTPKVSVALRPSTRQDKKWSVVLPNKTIHFGARGYSDYTIHKDTSRKDNYIKRHAPRENWEKSGIETAGFWSRWLLWNKPSIKESIKDIENKFNVKIVS